MSVLDECVRLQSEYEKTDEFLDKKTMITHRSIRDLKQEIQSLKAKVVEARPWVEIARDEGFFLKNSPPEKWLEETKDIRVDDE